MKRVEFSILEFDWVFKGDKAMDFIAHLAETENDELFAISSIKIIIKFLWKKFFTRILLFIFLPFFSYMTIFLVYVTHVYEERIATAEEERSEQLHLGFIITVLILIAFNLCLETR